jgi:Fe-S cluster assembly ATP-binding protein
LQDSSEFITYQNKMLKIENLNVKLEQKEILSKINLQILPGQIHVIMGPNGSGKSTLSQVLAGKSGYKIKGKVFFQPNFESKLSSIPELNQKTFKKLIQNQSLHLLKLEPNQRANLGFFLSFQHPPEIDGISLVNFLKSCLESQNKFFGKEKLNSTIFLSNLKSNLSLLNLPPDFYKRSLNEGFSGGEKKKNEILQLLTLNPQLAIFDEIDSGLDVDSLKIVANGIKKFFNSTKSIILITHYQRILNYIKPDFVHILINGKIIASGNFDLAKKVEKEGYKSFFS